MSLFGRVQRLVGRRNIKAVAVGGGAYTAGGYLRRKSRGVPTRMAQWAMRRNEPAAVVVSGRGRYAGVRVEEKFHDIEVTQASISNTGVVFNSLALIAQGVDEDERIGRSVCLKSMHLRGQCTLPEVNGAATPGDSDLMRMIVFIDKQANGATAGVTDLLAAADVNRFNNLNNKSRFRILKNLVVPMNYGTAGGVAGNVIQSQVLRKIKLDIPLNLVIEYSGGTGAITEVKSNNVGILLISGAGVVSLTSHVRVRFTDS